MILLGFQETPFGPLQVSSTGHAAAHSASQLLGFEVSNGDVFHLTCGHMFHLNCMEKWCLHTGRQAAVAGICTGQRDAEEEVSAPGSALAVTRVPSVFGARAGVIARRPSSSKTTPSGGASCSKRRRCDGGVLQTDGVTE